jgi:hypothetical protein
MAKPLRNDLELDIGGKGEACVGVSKIVQSDRWQARNAGQLQEMPRDVLGPEIPPVLSSEDESLVVPCRTPRGLLQLLSLSVVPQFINRGCVERDHAGSPLRFGGSNNSPAANIGYLLDNDQASAIKIHIFPSKADRYRTRDVELGVG